MDDLGERRRADVTRQRAAMQERPPQMRDSLVLAAKVLAHERHHQRARDHQQEEKDQARHRGRFSPPLWS
jgi:hypothetical protein